MEVCVPWMFEELNCHFPSPAHPKWHSPLPNQLSKLIEEGKAGGKKQQTQWWTCTAAECTFCRSPPFGCCCALLWFSRHPATQRIQFHIPSFTNRIRFFFSSHPIPSVPPGHSPSWHTSLISFHFFRPTSDKRRQANCQRHPSLMNFREINDVPPIRERGRGNWE